ncbi:macrophage colony-stimulating factor 1a isoform X3 [Scleropages formosus]|uniref:macrophage colony-stimulating factor 1a isoform X3 n=1 Tax=Scleropages formosus TaxID=113540 RepID=UPI000877EC17|nr:macrophage colony-stimulating factor 1 isoform X3 [Scleropages formosus]
MNTYKPDNTFCKAKAGHWFFVLLLCFRLAFAEVPGPCRHSVTKDHLQKFKRLIENQLQNGCLINYTFTERQSLGKICYVKAALHQIQDLLQNHFKYARSSDNYRYVNELKEVIKNIFSQKCIPDIDEAHEDDPIKFQKVYHTSPKEALQKAQKVIELYMELMMENNAPVNWNCEEEFGQDYIESTIVTIRTTGRVPHSSQHPSAKGSSSIKAVGDHGKDSKINTSELPNISYKTAFIMASVCGGLLLITALYCYKEQQKLRTLLQRHKMVDNQRLNVCSSDLEMQMNNGGWQHCATEEGQIISNGNSL